MSELEIFERNLRPMQVWALRAEDKLQAWKVGQVEGMSTGFNSLDDYSRLVDGDLILIAARPSMGKTSLAMQIAQHAAHQIQTNNVPGCVAVFSAEMTGWSLVLRMASALCGVNVHSLRQGRAKPAEYAKMQRAIDTLRTLPLWIDDNSGPTTAQMLESLQELSETNPVRLMVFDFMELGGDRDRNEEQRISQIAQNLKAISKTLSIPVIAINQLSRQVETRANKMPSLSDLRYSGMLEQIADVVLLIMRPEYYIKRGMAVEVPQGDERGVAYVQFAKNRHGPVGLKKLAFIEEQAKFAELETVRVELNGRIDR